MVGPLERSNIYIDDMGSSTVPDPHEMSQIKGKKRLGLGYYRLPAADEGNRQGEGYKQGAGDFFYHARIEAAGEGA